MSTYLTKEERLSYVGPFSPIRVNILDIGRISIHDVISWTLPLTETNTLNKSKIVPEVYKILSGQRLCKYISDMLISRDILEIHFSLCTMSWMKWYLISMYFKFSWKIGLSMSFTQLWLSQYITVISSTWSNSLVRNFQSHTTS